MGASVCGIHRRDIYTMIDDQGTKVTVFAYSTQFHSDKPWGNIRDSNRHCKAQVNKQDDIAGGCTEQI